MKVTGILRAYTKDNQILQESVEVNMYGYNNSLLHAKVNNIDLAFFLPSTHKFNEDIYYEITNPEPLNKLPEETKDNKERKFLIVSFEK